jgi:hypothetical protein
VLGSRPSSAYLLLRCSSTASASAAFRVHWITAFPQSIRSGFGIQPSRTYAICAAFQSGSAVSARSSSRAL